MNADEARRQATEAVRALVQKTNDVEAGYLQRMRDVDAVNLSQRDRLKALEAENAALKTYASQLERMKAPEAWCDMPTCSHRHAGDALLVAEQCGACWATYTHGAPNARHLGDGATREAAKAILDAAVAPKKAPRYRVHEDRGAFSREPWCVLDDAERVHCRSPKKESAERVAAWLNAAEEKP